MRKLLKSMKTLLLVAAGLCVGQNAWGAGYTRTLTEQYVVAGYKTKAFYNFQTNTPEVLPTSGDLRYRSDDGIWGLHNYGSGNRSATATIPVAEGDILVIQEYSSNYATTINRGTENNVLTNTYRVFNITSTANNITFTTPRYGGIVAALVMEKDNTAATADYTINYKNGNDIVKTVSGTGEAIGTIIPVESSFIIDKVKYITDGGQATTLTIGSGENVLNIAVSVAPKYSYTVNAKAGNVVKVLAQGSTYSGDAVIIPYPKYINVDGTLYEKGVTNKEYRQSVTVNEDNQVTDFTYNATNTTNVVYFSEAEEIGTATSAGSNMATRSSNAQCGYAESDINLVNLPAGMYEITAVVYSNSSGGATVKFQFGDETWNAVVSGADNWSQQAKTFTLTSASDIKWLTSGDTKNGLDFVYIRQTAVPATITSAGYATFSSTSALDFSETIDGLTGVYYASKVESGSVTMTELNQKVPANTGLFLKGTANTTITIPVAVEGTDIDGTNYLKPTTEEEIAASANGTYHYVYAYTPGDVITDAGFYNLANAVTPGAGKAYLETTMDIKPNTASAKVSIMFVNSDATGISSINADSSVNADANSCRMYNLGGQRVGKDYKGIVIVNGKKYNQ